MEGVQLVVTAVEHDIVYQGRFWGYPLSFVWLTITVPATVGLEDLTRSTVSRRLRLPCVVKGSMR